MRWHPMGRRRLRKECALRAENRVEGRSSDVLM